MTRPGWFWLTLAVLNGVLSISAVSSASDSNEPDGNVILLMLDGVREQEVFEGVDRDLSRNDGGAVFSFLWKELIQEGMILGDRKNGSKMTVANSSFISLPAYQSIMAGRTQNCASNSCGRIRVETIQERLIRELRLDKKQVATIASWEQIPFAVEHIAGTSFVNAAFQPLNDGEYDAQVERLNELQKKDVPPWHGARYDRYTFSHAMHFLKKHHPRFMFISLNDADEWAHKGDYPQYISILRQYDAWIKVLSDILKSSGEYGRKTTLIVTTDHGRGAGGSWTNHGFLWPDSKYIWLFGKRPGATMAGLISGPTHTHLDIRPTIEAAMGLKPQGCLKCGHVIGEFAPVAINLSKSDL